MKYIEFNLVEQKPKTSIWAVRNIASQIILGYIKWHPQWRQYCFFPESDTIFSVGCLNDINSFIIEETNRRKNG
jgi:hypothetical protein